jgi:hypothetical protein
MYYVALLTVAPLLLSASFVKRLRVPGTCEMQGGMGIHYQVLLCIVLLLLLLLCRSRPLP